MAKLVDEIVKLTDPTPKFIDPEDDINIETTAHVVERFEESLNIHPELSKLRQQTTPLLEDFDDRYTGKRVSRESLGQADGTVTEPSSGDEEAEDDDAADQNLKCFKQQILGSIQLQNSTSQELYSDKSSDELHDESEEEEGSEDDFSEGSDTGDDEDEQQTEDDMLKKFSHIDVNEEIEQGKAVGAQLGLWNKFCESRIQLQKIITRVNQLPQFDVWCDFKNRAAKSYSDPLKKGPVVIKSLLDSMLQVQSQLLLNNPETKSYVSMASNPSAQESGESESGNEETMQNKKNPFKEEGKRKWSLNEYDDILAKRFKAFVPYRNSVIQKWDDKTHLITGRISKSFNDFSQPAVIQINQILQDKQRLIQRTQLKRSTYRILGKNEDNESNVNQSGEKDEVVDGHSKRDEHLNCHDPEIFDDDDFYHVLLKDIIKAKTIGMDPDLLRTHLELQKNRRKMRKKVDTKASKGRKLRYDLHPKMVSFKSCVNTLYPEGTRTDLLKRLFSQSSTIHAQ